MENIYKLKQNFTITIFHTEKVPKEDSHCIYVSIILIESAFKASENYYLKVFFRRM